MALRSAIIADDIIWRTPLPNKESALATSVQNKIQNLRPHLLDFLRLNETPPHQAMTLEQWTQPNALRSLLAIYSDHIYRNNPTQVRESKPLISLWAQWYIGLLVPPLLLALLTEDIAIEVNPERFHVEFHETGRAACFWIEVRQDRFATHLPAADRLESLITNALMPVVCALEATGEINAKLIWNNTGYLINWYLGEMKSLLGDTLVETLRQRCFFEQQLSNGQDNPLWRTVVSHDGLLVRRTCCQRYRLPDVKHCGDCTLK